MKTAHRCEVGGECFGMACLKLLNEELYVGGDDFLRGLRLRCGGGQCEARLLLWLVSCWSLAVAMDAHGVVFSVFEWLCCVCSPNTPWPWPTPAGAASARLRGKVPPGTQWRACRRHGLHKRIRWKTARSFFHQLVARQGRSPFHVFCQWLGAGVIAPAVNLGCVVLPNVLGTGQRSATVAQTSIRGLVTA